MKQTSILVALILAMYCARGQGTFQYDQQSVTDQSQPVGITTPIQTQQPIGQSFTPDLSSIGFVTLYLSDQTLGGSGSTVYVNLWSGSIGTGTLLDSTDPVFVPHGSFSYENFFFPTGFGVTPGATYYLQPVIQSGDSDNNMVTGLISGTSYPNGTTFINGSSSSFDILFREGVVVPEPSCLALALLGVVGMCPVLRRRPNLNRRIHQKKTCSEELSQHWIIRSFWLHSYATF